MAPVCHYVVWLLLIPNFLILGSRFKNQRLYKSISLKFNYLHFLFSPCFSFFRMHTSHVAWKKNNSVWTMEITNFSHMQVC